MNFKIKRFKNSFVKVLMKINSEKSNLNLNKKFLTHVWDDGIAIIGAVVFPSLTR